ncbi:22551_t:CDS:2, partial [Entrophospora sp. SA101]
MSSPAEPHTCYDNEFTPNQARKVKSVSCAMVDEKPKTKTLKNQAASSNMFTINLKCLSPNAAFCGKAKKSLDVTGETITKVLMLKEPIVVDITFKPLSPGVIGQTGVSRFIPLKGSDGVDRAYPQGLVKQFGLPSHPAFLPFDIIAEFSSELNFWFDDDTTPIAKNQLSFSYMTLHEFILTNYREKHHNGISIESVNDKKILEKQLCEFVVGVRRDDGEEYLSLKNCMAAIDRHLKSHSVIKDQITLNGNACKQNYPDLYKTLNGKLRDLKKQ